MKTEFVDEDAFRKMTGLGTFEAKVLDRALKQVVDKFGAEIPEGTLELDLRRRSDVNAGYVGVGSDYENIPAKLMGPLSRSVTIRLGDLPVSDKEEWIVFPLTSVFKRGNKQNAPYQLYQHQFWLDESGQEISCAKYTGITRRGWGKRWREHQRAARSGSRYRFHSAIRHWAGKARLTVHWVLGVGLTESAAMDLEQRTVEGDTLYPLGLNMVPGGNAGIAYLHKIGALSRGDHVTPDDKHEIINRFFDRASREGIPNPLAAANWLNSNYAERVICGPEGRLKPDQIRQARFLSSLGRSAEDIANQVAAKNLNQIHRLLDGKTYARVA